MKKMTDVSLRNAALIVGLGLIIMFFLAIFAEGVLSNLVVLGDSSKTAKNFKANAVLFNSAMICYAIVLILDALVAFALYIIFKNMKKNLALLLGFLRFIYTVIMVISLLALVLLNIDMYFYLKLFAYVFFISHIFIFGIVIFKSNFMPNVFGVLLIFATFCYIILMYGEFFLAKDMLEVMTMIVMVPAVLGEILPCVWLLVKSAKLEELIEEK